MSRHPPSCLPDVMHVTLPPRPSPLIFAYCKQTKAGGGNGLGTRLVSTTAELGENAAKYAFIDVPVEKAVGQILNSS